MSADGHTCIVVSRDDHASEHIGDHILEETDWTELGDDHYISSCDSTADGPTGDDPTRDDPTTGDSGGFELRVYDDLHLHLENIADDFQSPRFLVFVSRHSGDTGPLLSAHFTGNLGAAEFGGYDHALAPACPNAQRVVLEALDANAPEGYDVTLECTHHGPSDPGAPSMFVELGSEDEQWRDPDGARAVARAVLELDDVPATTDRTLVAFGGGHYAPRPTRIVRETDWACGHVAADWGLDELGDPRDNPEVVEQVFERSGATIVIVDGENPELEATIADLGYRVVSETWVRETTGVPLDRVDSLEANLATVDDGLRFGTAAETENGEFVVDLPAALMADANGVDMTAITDAARSTGVAYETRENGNRVAGRAAFPSKAQYDAFIGAVCGVLERRFDSVDRRADEIVVHERAFDPHQAAALGVPEGPKFGALANGDSVTVDGETITPADVTTDQTRRYQW